MRIQFSLSAKKSSTGRQEILFKLQPMIDGRRVTMNAHSGVFVVPRYFDKFEGVRRLDRSETCTAEALEAENARGEITALASYVDRAYGTADKEAVTKDWLREALADYRNGKRNAKPTFDNLFRAFLDHLDETRAAENTKRNYLSLLRLVRRYVGFRTRNGERFDFDVDTLTRDDLSAFRNYMRHEHEYYRALPALYDTLMGDCERKLPIRQKCENSIVLWLRLLRTFINWLIKTGKTQNDPYKGFEGWSTSVYGEPVYITIEERDQVATAEMPTEALAVHRDVFIFQCLVGCRVSDLMRFTERNVTHGVLTYIPNKTKGEGEQARVARVPLIPQALELIEKYRGRDRQGRLFPCTGTQVYGRAIKKVFKAAGLTYDVEVLNKVTGEKETRPINELASSHMARRTFVGNLYNKVQDPNLIGKMSGHVDGSRAFARYRKVDTDTLRDVVKLLEG